jgi:hypothetical protein
MAERTKPAPLLYTLVACSTRSGLQVCNREAPKGLAKGSWELCFGPLVRSVSAAKRGAASRSAA